MKKINITNMKELAQSVSHEYQIKDAWVLAVSYDQVLVGKFSDDNFIFSNDIAFERLMDVRVFNQTKQVRFLETGYPKELSKCFFICETVDDKPHYEDQYFACLGNHIDTPFNGFNTLVKDTNRGTTISYPFELSEADLKTGVALIVRNYFHFEDSQLVSRESRLVGFQKGGELV